MKRLLIAAEIAIPDNAGHHAIHENLSPRCGGMRGIAKLSENPDFRYAVRDALDGTGLKGLAVGILGRAHRSVQSLELTGGNMRAGE